MTSLAQNPRSLFLEITTNFMEKIRRRELFSVILFGKMCFIVR